MHATWVYRYENVTRAPLHKIWVWTQIRKIKCKLSFNQSESRINDLRLISVTCFLVPWKPAKPQLIMSNGAMDSYRCTLFIEKGQCTLYCPIVRYTYSTFGTNKLEARGPCTLYTNTWVAPCDVNFVGGDYCCLCCFVVNPWKPAKPAKSSADHEQGAWTVTGHGCTLYWWKEVRTLLSHC